MQQPAINDSTIYFGILLGLFFLYRVWQSVKPNKDNRFGFQDLYRTITSSKHRASFLITAINLFLWCVAILFTTSGLFYWRLRNIALLQPGIETYLLSLDIVLAHLVTTVPVILFFLFLLWKILNSLSRFTLFISTLIFSESAIGIYLTASVIMFIFSGLISYLFVYSLLINTIDLQIFLFGAHDPNLGLVFPTTFRFSILSSHLQTTYQTLASNQLVAGIAGLLAVIISVILGLASIIKAVDDIGSKIKTGDVDGKK